MLWFDGREKRTAVNAAICPNRVEYEQEQKSLEVFECTVSAPNTWTETLQRTQRFRSLGGARS
jgi:hypothetical protein